MEEKTTMEITNDRLEEAIKDYAADRTKEKLTAVLNLKHAIPGVQQRCRKTGIEFKRNGHQSIYR